EITARRNFLNEDDEGNERDPTEVHYTCCEDKCHQCPAAADAIDTMVQTHYHRPAATFTPVCSQEGERCTTNTKARALERRPLVDACRNENCAAEQRCRRCHGLREQRLPVKPHLCHSREYAERSPH